MDTKQLITGSPKEGFYPIVQDTVTVIELNKAVLSLTSESSSEDIIAAFDSVEDFTTLLQNVRNTENIINGVLVNDSSLVGKIFCNIIAHSTQETLYIDGVFTNQYFNITITNTNGTFSCVKNIVYLNKEVGNKTNVLILSLENDLANGQKDSPVTTEVSTALKNAISTGKACVIKSTNSDILANLQQISDNVTIVMEQISRVGQTFVAVNTTITVNTATNIISDYQTGAIVLETEGDGSKFLSDDGSYKEVNSSSVVISVDLNLSVASTGASYDFSQIYNAYISGKTVYLKDSLNNLYLVINATNESVAYYVETGTDEPTLYWFRNVHYGSSVGTMYVISIVDNLDNVLTKNNTTSYTPTGDYNPATKKYVDDNISLNNKNVFVVNDGYNLLDIDNYSEWTEKISIPKKLSSNNTLFIINIRNITNNDDLDNSIIVNIRTKPTSSTVGCSNNISDAIGNKYNIHISIKYENSPSNDDYYSATFTCKQFKYIQRVLTESEYAALGTTPETDNVLYFITPD